MSIKNFPVGTVVKFEDQIGIVARLIPQDNLVAVRFEGRSPDAVMGLPAFYPSSLKRMNDTTSSDRSRRAIQAA